MRFTRLASSTLALHFALFAITPTRALADDKGTAVKMFEDASELMKKKDFAAACPLLKKSMDLVPLDGTVLRLAVCYQSLGKWASSSILFKESLARAERATPPRKDRVELSTKGIADVEKRMSFVTIEVKPDVRASGLEVMLDGQRVLEASFGSPIPIDPGEHSLSASAAGKKPWETTFSIAATAERKTIDVPKLVDAPVDPVPTPVAAPTPTPAPALPADVSPAASTPTAAYVAIGGGLVLIGGAVLMRVKMESDRKDYVAGCAEQPTVVCEDQVGRTRVRTWETLSWVSGAMGLVALGVGVTLFVTAPRGDSKKAAIVASPATVAGGAGFLLSGSF